jgi:hypothetical protein
MYIECLETYPVASARGKRIHVPRSVAEIAIYRGEAKPCPRPNYGTPEWIAERQQAAANAVPHTGDVDANSKGVEWGIQDRAQSPLSIVTIIKRSGCETTFFKEPPADCPPSIVAQWQAMTQTEDASGSARAATEAAKQKQYAQKEDERVGMFAQIFRK